MSCELRSDGANAAKAAALSLSLGLSPLNPPSLQVSPSPYTVSFKKQKSSGTTERERGREREPNRSAREGVAFGLLRTAKEEKELRR